MLTRRAFTGFVSCAICAITSEFLVTEAAAQTTPPAGTAGVTRKILSQTDGPAPGYVTVLVEATIEAGGAGPRTTHPRIETAHVLGGGSGASLPGQKTPTGKNGGGFPKTPANAPPGG